MVRLEDFRPGEQVIPESEAARQARFAEYAKYYDGKWALGEGHGNDRRVNWFRRVAHAYPELLYSDRATISIEGNEQLTNLIPVNTIFSAFYHAAIDMIRFGTGVVAIPLANPSGFTSTSPTQWYPLYDEYFDNQIGDIIVRRVGRFTDGRDNSLDKSARVIVDIYEYGEVPRRMVFRQKGTAFGEIVKEQTYDDLDPELTYVTSLVAGENIGGYGESFYPDIIEAVKEMGSELHILASNIKENSDPNLYGPDGAIAVNDAGEYVVEDGAQYIPVEPGQSPPGFLQWDSDATAIQVSYKLNEELVYVFSGLPRGLYDPSVVSATALMRTLRAPKNSGSNSREPRSAQTA